MPPELLKLGYLIAAILFIYGLKGLMSPRTAVRGNMLGALGMLLAVVVTLLDQEILSFLWIAIGMTLGTVVGVVAALKIQMTAMPQMVALLNGFGGLASAMVAGAATMGIVGRIAPVSAAVATAISGLIGAVTLSGSMIAFAKLQELMKGAPLLVPFRHAINGLLAATAIAACVWVVLGPYVPIAYLVLILVALGLGVLLVLPVGGADMPVVIALLNAFSGLAAAATGFVIDNSVLIVAGSLVGSSGIILTRLMCKAMNRSLVNVIFGVMSSGTSDPGAGKDLYEGRVKSTNGEELAMILDAASRVVFVPGYGLAVSQAQHAVRELTDLLLQRGKEVEFGIHPVAGRMPGHMNVLLAEAEIPYDLLKDMDAINPTFARTDVVLVIGANDVVNPLARTNPSSPIGGMPILNVDEARTVVVVKRSLSPGYAGIDNPLFAADNALMLFADAKKGLNEVIAAFSEL